MLVSAPGPGPGDGQCQSIVPVPLTAGVVAPSPPGSFNGEPQSQRDQLNGPTRVALTSDTWTKSSEQVLQQSSEQVLQQEQVCNIHSTEMKYVRGKETGGSAEDSEERGKMRI